MAVNFVTIGTRAINPWSGGAMTVNFIIGGVCGGGAHHLFGKMLNRLDMTLGYLLHVTVSFRTVPGDRRDVVRSLRRLRIDGGATTRVHNQ